MDGIFVIFRFTRRTYYGGTEKLINIWLHEKMAVKFATVKAWVFISLGEYTR